MESYILYVDTFFSLITYFQIACGVEQQVARFQVPVQHISRMDVLEPSKDLVEEVADVVITEMLGLKELVEVCFHKGLYYIAIGTTQLRVATLINNRQNGLQLILDYSELQT